MFDTFFNHVSLSFLLKPEGPLLVRSQKSGIDPAIADNEFHRTTRDGKPTVFLAGSGLKGAIRAHCERLLKSRGRFVCNPTVTRESCGAKSKGHRDRTQYPHHEQCPACFTFGSTRLAGRFRVGDAYPPDELAAATNRTEVRTSVGIDRATQAANGGTLFDNEVVVGGGFEVLLSGENVALWQVALIAQTLRDLDMGFVQIGGCKARGMGTVQVCDRRITFRFLKGKPGLLTGAVSKDYGLDRGEEVPIGEGSGIETGRAGLFQTVNYVGDSVDGLFDRLISGPLAAYLNGRA